MNRRVELCNDKDITSTLTVSSTIRIAVGSNYGVKEKLVTKCGCVKNFAMFNSYTGVSTGG